VKVDKYFDSIQILNIIWYTTSTDQGKFSRSYFNVNVIIFIG